MRFDRMVDAAGYPGSKMVPACNALLSLLLLKLLDKERRSHIDDFNCDEDLGLWAGLNILPKKSFATDYSYRTQRRHQEKLLQGWVSKLSPLLFPQAESFSLDFHAIPHRGEETDLENHYQPMRGKAGPSILSFFAQEQKSRVLCYANANLTRDDQPGEVLQFVEFWHDLTGKDPQWLYFDSRLTTYAELSQLTERGISFVTIRRRGGGLLRRLAALPESAWQKAIIDIPKRRHQQIWYVDERVALPDYAGMARQVAVKGLGREQPTLFLSNNAQASPARPGHELCPAQRGGRRAGQQRQLLPFGLSGQRRPLERGFGHGPDGARPRAATGGWPANFTALAKPSPSESIGSSWRHRERSRSSRGGGSWCTSTGALTIQSCARRNWTRTVRRFRGWGTVGYSSSICDPYLY